MKIVLSIQDLLGIPIVAVLLIALMLCGFGLFAAHGRQIGIASQLHLSMIQTAHDLAESDINAGRGDWRRFYDRYEAIRVQTREREYWMWWKSWRKVYSADKLLDRPQKGAAK